MKITFESIERMQYQQLNQGKSGEDFDPTDFIDNDTENSFAEEEVLKKFMQQNIELKP